MREARSAPPPAGYDAVVVGGPMIMGWHKDAEKYLKRHREPARARCPCALFVTAASLTEDGMDAVHGVPVAKDPWLVKKPRNADKLTRKERYALPSHYVGDILKDCAPSRPRNVAVFAGSLDLTTMNVFEKLFVLLVVGRDARRRPPLGVHPRVGGGARRGARPLTDGAKRRDGRRAATVARQARRRSRTSARRTTAAAAAATIAHQAGT